MLPPSFGQHGGAVASPAPKIGDSSSFVNISLNLHAHDCLQSALHLKSGGFDLLFQVRDLRFHSTDVSLNGTLP
jgi:hypothetical protein